MNQPQRPRPYSERVKMLKATAAGETRTREAMQQRAEAESLRAEAAERALRDLAVDRDRWRRRALAAEAELHSLKRNA